VDPDLVADPGEVVVALVHRLLEAVRFGREDLESDADHVGGFVTLGQHL
jgi:hypothetical protein